MFVYLNIVKIFTTDFNTCTTDKKFKKEQNEFNKTQVTEKTFTDSSSVYKFLCVTPKYKNF